jgi:hypothetical protein
MITERAATALKYQRQCIAKGEQNLAEAAERAAIEVTKRLICSPVAAWRGWAAVNAREAHRRE